MLWFNGASPDQWLTVVKCLFVFKVRKFVLVDYFLALTKASRLTTQ